MPKPKQDLVAQTLSDAFMRLCAVKPLSKITVKDICEESGFSKRTFYNHFKGKDDLLSWNAARMVKDMLHSLGDSFSYRDLIRGCFTNLAAQASFIRSAYFDAGASRAMNTGVVKDSTEAFLDYFKAHGADLDDAKVRFTLDYHFSANTAVMIDWVVGGMREDPEVLTDWIIDAMPPALKALLP